MFANPMLHQILMFCFFALTIAAALNDLKEFRIPNRISLALLALYPLHVLASPLPIDWLMALAVAGLVFAAGLTLFFCGLVGGGDVKFLAAASLWAGAALTIPLLCVMGLAGGVLALVALGVQNIRRYRSTGIAGVIVPDTTIAAPKLPYGVAIAAGAFYAGVQLLALT
jgi:prepilin peptidase CpaA